MSSRNIEYIKSNKMFRSSDNNKLYDRHDLDMDMSGIGRQNHQLNMNRINIERDGFFNQDTRGSYENGDEFRRMPERKRDNRVMSKREKTGEITGEIINDDYQNYDQGMPIRSQYNIKKPLHDSNMYTDFDIFNKQKNTSDFKVSSFDPGSSGTTGYADVMVSMTKLSNQVQPAEICSNGVEKIGFNLFNNLFGSLQKSNFITNGYGLYSLFSSLYLASTGTTEIELKNYFDFPKKEYIYKGLYKVIDETNAINKMFNSRNIIIIGNDVPYNMHYCDNIRDLGIIFRVNISKPDTEADRVNKLIKKLMGHDMRRTVISENIIDLQVMFANLLVIRPIWHVAFDKVVKGSFYTHDGKRDANYMYGVGKSFGYYEDNLIQLVEVKCLKQSSSMGIILAKNDDEFDFDETKIKFYISHLKDVVLDEIKIPTFKQDLKMRYNSILKVTGLNTVFTKIVAPDFFPETAVLHDVVQNVSIVVDNIYGQQHELNRGYRTSRKFLATKPFIYYFRLTDTNTILLVGSYC